MSGGPGTASRGISAAGGTLTEYPAAGRIGGQTERPVATFLSRLCNDAEDRRALGAGGPSSLAGTLLSLYQQ
jgi:hypothetical protein